MKHAGRLAALLCSVLTVAMLCGISVHAGAQTVDLAKKEKLKVAYSSSVVNLQSIAVWIARDKGILQKYGLEVDVTLINGAGPTLLAVISGEADLGLVDPTQLIIAVNKGEKMRGVVNTTPKQIYLLLAHTGIKTLKDLAGKRVGISQPGTISQTLVDMTLRKNGVDTRNIQWVAVGGAGPRYQAIVRQRVDAGIGQIVYGIRGEKDGVHSLANLGDEMPDLMGYTYAAKLSNIEQNRGAMIKFAAALIEATRLLLADGNMTLDIYLKNSSGVNRTEAQREYDLLKKSAAWGADGKVTAPALAFTGKTMVDEGQIKTVPAFDDVFAQNIVEAALRLVAQTK